MQIVDCSSPGGQLRAQVCFEEVLKLRNNKLEGADSKLREKKDRKKLSRAARSSQSREVTIHRPCRLILSSQRATSDIDPAAGEVTVELFGSSNEARRGPDVLSRGSARLRR